MFWEIFYDLCLKNKKKPLHIVKEVGIAAGSITKWKNGAVPSGASLAKIADHFGVSVDYLLGKEKTPTTISRDERSDDFARLFSSLSEEQQKLIILQMRGILSERE